MAIPEIFGSKVYFPYPVTTNRIRLNIVEGGFQIATKIDLLGTTSINLYRSDPTFVVEKYEKGM